MEDGLGVRLFTRTTHGVSLTQSGMILAQKAEHLIDHCNAAARRIHTEGLPMSGEIHVACALELAYSSHIKVFVSRFMERYPDIRVCFDVKSEGTPEEILRTSPYDFVFTPCEYLGPGPGIHMHLLHRHGTYAALPPGHRLLSKSLIYLRELEGETIVVPFAHELFGPYARNWLLVRKYTHEKVSCIKVPNLSTALFLVSIGKGIAIIPRYARKFASENIMFSVIANELCSFHEYLYYKATTDNQAARVFYEEVLGMYAAAHN